MVFLMVLHSRKLLRFCLLTLFLPLLAACDDGPEAKAGMQQALAKQAEAASYRFSGAAELELASIPAPGANPLASGLNALLKNSKLEWSGVAAAEPLRLEADLSVAPQGSSSSFQLPMIINDSKLYVHIPLLNGPDEYTAWNMAADGEAEAAAKLPVENLKNAQGASLDILHLLLDDLDASSFKRDKKTGELVFSIDEKNSGAVSETWTRQRRAIADKLLQHGLTTNAQAEAVAGDGAAPWAIVPPGEIRLSVDEQGFIAELRVDLYFRSVLQSSMPGHIRLTNRYEEINQNPPFAKDIPSRVKPFEQIAKFLGKP